MKMANFPQLTELLNALSDPVKIIELDGIQKLGDGRTVERKYFFYASEQVIDGLSIVTQHNWSTGAFLIDLALAKCN